MARRTRTRKVPGNPEDEEVEVKDAELARRTRERKRILGPASSC